MSNPSITVVYHPKCQASTDFIIKVSKLQNYDIQYINLKDDTIETSIEVDVVPLMIIDNDPSKIFKGKQAFDKIESLITREEGKTQQKQTTGSLKYGQTVTFKEDTGGKKETIKLPNSR